MASPLLLPPGVTFVGLSHEQSAEINTGPLSLTELDRVWTTKGWGSPERAVVEGRIVVPMRSVFLYEAIQDIRNVEAVRLYDPPQPLVVIWKHWQGETYSNLQLGYFITCRERVENIYWGDTEPPEWLVKAANCLPPPPPPTIWERL